MFKDEKREGDEKEKGKNVVIPVGGWEWMILWKGVSTE